MPPQDASRFFDQYASLFDAIYGGGNSAWTRFIHRRFRASMWLRFQQTLAACEPVAGKRILDVGCGPGHYVAALADRGAEKVVGIDSAPAMIELARERCARSGVAGRSELVCAPFAGHDFQGTFDHVVCMGFLEYMARPDSTIGAIMKLSRQSALFSLPDRHGFLALQRRIRYRFRTPLYMYSRQEVDSLFSGVPGVDRFGVVRLARDYFITAWPVKSVPRPEASPGLDRST